MGSSPVLVPRHRLAVTPGPRGVHLSNTSSPGTHGLHRVAVIFLTGVAVSLLSTGVATSGELSLLHTFASPNERENGHFGFAVSGVDDVNGDGFGDAVIGAPGENSPSGVVKAGRAYLFSGSSGALITGLASPDQQYDGWFGRSVSGAGDIDGDGIGDLLVGAPGEDGGSGPDFSGRAYVVSGATFAVLHTLSSPSPTEFGQFGWCVCSAGDVNDDGTTDLLVGAVYDHSNYGGAYVFSGATGELLWGGCGWVEFALYGHSASCAGNVDGDCHSDLVVGAPMEDYYGGCAHVYSGASGGEHLFLESPNSEYHGQFGYSVSGVGDIDGDGFCDVAVGAPWEDPGSSPDDAGRVYVFSGATGSLVWELVSPNEEADGFFGLSVAGAGDVDADGGPDVIVGARDEDPGSSPSNAGRAYVFSGMTGAVLYELTSPNEEVGGYFGWALSSIGDADGDRRPEILVGAYQEDPGTSLTDAGRAYLCRSPMLLSGELAGGELLLTWSPKGGTFSYWVYGAANRAYFSPGVAPGYQHRLAMLSPLFRTWSSPNGVGNPDSNWTYMVLAVDASEQEMCRSNRVGEHDFDMGN